MGFWFTAISWFSKEPSSDWYPVKLFIGLLWFAIIVLALPHRLSKDVFKVLRLQLFKKHQQTLRISAYDSFRSCNMWDDDPSLLECLAYSLKWRVLSIFYYVQASMFVFVLCMPLVRILNWVFVLIEPLMLLVYVFIFSILLTILSGKKIVIFFYKLMLFFYSGYESSWFILSYYLLTLLGIFIK